MFIQVMEGHTSQPDAVRQRLDVWEAELKSGATGYLGSTSGVTADGDCVLLARFDDAEVAKRNSDRAEQGAWWAETEKCFDGPVTFHDSADVKVMARGDLDSAGFIQFMKGHVTDRARADELDRMAEETLGNWRPDLLGMVTVYYGDGEFASMGYFTNEADAREGEKKEMPAEFAADAAEWDSVMKVDTYLDITDPWLTSP